MSKKQYPFCWFFENAVRHSFFPVEGRSNKTEIKCRMPTFVDRCRRTVLKRTTRALQHGFNFLKQSNIREDTVGRVEPIEIIFESSKYAWFGERSRRIFGFRMDMAHISQILHVIVCFERFIHSTRDNFANTTSFPEIKPMLESSARPFEDGVTITVNKGRPPAFS